jgi:hypothetical protein
MGRSRPKRVVPANRPNGTRSASWWVGLDRQSLAREIAAHEPIWRVQKARFLDHVGEQLIGWREPIIRTGTRGEA